MALEYCCTVGRRPEGEAAMHGAFTVRRATLELGNALATDSAKAKSMREKSQS